MPEGWLGAREAHRSLVRERIVHAALQLVAERGMSATTMSELAERSQISRPTLYSHFSDVEQVLAAWLADEVDRVQVVMAERLSEHEDPLARLEAYVLVQCEYFAGSEYAFSIGRLDARQHSSVLGDVIAAHVEKFEAEVRDMLAEATQRDMLRGDLDVALHAQLVLGLVDATRARLAQGTLTPQGAAATITGLLRRGLG